MILKSRQHLNGRVYKSTPDCPPRLDVIRFFAAITTIIVQPACLFLLGNKRKFFQTLTFYLACWTLTQRLSVDEQMLKVSWGCCDDPPTMQQLAYAAPKVGTSSNYLRGASAANQARVIFCWAGEEIVCRQFWQICWCQLTPSASPTPSPENPFWEKIVDSGKINVQTRTDMELKSRMRWHWLLLLCCHSQPTLLLPRKQFWERYQLELPTIKVSRSRAGLVVGR